MSEVYAVDAPSANNPSVDEDPRSVPPREHDREVIRAVADTFTTPLEYATTTVEVLRQRERQLEFITDALPVLIAYVDRDQRYQFVSAEYERWFGVSKDQFVGKQLQEVLGDEAYGAILPHLRLALAGQTVTYQAELPYRGVGSRFVEATYVPQRALDGQVLGFVSLVADVTERKTFEDYRAQAAVRAERLLKVTAALANAVSQQDVFEALVDQVADAINASSAGLWLADPNGEHLTLARSRGYPGVAQRAFGTLKIEGTASVPLLDATLRNEPVFIGSRAELVALYPHVEPYTSKDRGYRTACLPLVVHGRRLGVLGVTVEAENEQSHAEREFLLLVARYASQALERLRLLSAERSSRAQADAAAHRLGVLNRASRAFVDSGLDLHARMQRVAEELATALDGAINIALIEADGLLHLCAVRHPDPEAHELLARITPTTPLRVGEGVTGNIAATGKSILIEHIDQTLIKERAPEHYRSFLERFPAYSLIGAPLLVRGRVIGTVTAARMRQGSAYTSEDLRLLEELAERAALAIDNSRLYEETVEARARAEQLYRFAQAVMKADRLEVVFEAALAAIETSLHVTRAAILTYDKDEVMRFKAWRNLSDEYRRTVEGHSPWPRDARMPEPVLISDAQHEPSLSDYLPLFEREKIGALAFVPLVTGGRLLGKFMIYHDRPHIFASHELETALAISNHLASVITRFTAVARLEETIRQNELLAGVLAHDLRNPLGAIMTAAQILLMRREGEDALTLREQKPLSRILSSGTRMKVMIEQLLDFTRARSGGGIDVVPHATNLGTLCAEAVGELELSHPDWKITQKVMGDLHGEWDSDRLLQVLSNLVANAGQHGAGDEGVLIKLDGTLPDRVTLEVHNRGAVPEALLPNLFDPFRATSHRRGQSRGVGLGLFIVREIVRAHGGDVTVTSTESAGTTFTVTLPRKRPAGPRSHPPSGSTRT